MLYTIKHIQGFFHFRGVREIYDTDPTQTHIIADMQQIGALLPISVPVESVEYFYPEKERPVTMYTYFEKRFCDQCLAVHFVEITDKGREICHGETFTPRDTATHYVKRSGRGYKLAEKFHPANAIALDWQMAADEHDRREEAKLSDWLDLGI